MTRQLDVFGGEADAADVAQAQARLAPSQHAILTLARRPQGVTSSEAGAVIHGARNGGRGCSPWRHDAAPGRPCCPWVSSDGSDAIKRLRRRGIVEKRDEPRVAWYVVEAS